MKSQLYYECHITLDPIPLVKLGYISERVAVHKFRIAELYMRKRGDNGEYVLYEDDCFISGRDEIYEHLFYRMTQLVDEIVQAGLIVRRVKMEDTLFDTRHPQGWPTILAPMKEPFTVDTNWGKPEGKEPG